MNAYYITTLLRIYGSEKLTPTLHYQAAIAYLADEGMIYGADIYFETTNKGDVYVRALTEVNLPISKWVIPE